MEFWHVILWFILSFLFSFCGLMLWRRPDLAGGELKLNKSPTFYSVKYIKASNAFLLKYVSYVGIGFIVTGLLSFIFTIAYLIRPEILLIYEY